ncbi:hypothetical protein TeGR_g11413 [Tetraparma gracilis]|uniref:Uncharacterized protein n=1 Tax=Tetraparma gracilis TaxID=2962635 RepID=A0ABQ6MCA2_9STRA|nr:hypothetical protein TeGR_g11413 [Tetraparma gracilis]
MLSLTVSNLKRVPPLFPLLPASSAPHLRVQCDLKLSTPVPNSDTGRASLLTRTTVHTQRTRNSSPLSSSACAWPGSAGRLAWELPAADFRLLALHNPKLRLHVYGVVEAAGGEQSMEALGWAVVDVRDLGGSARTDWAKVNGAGGGCEVKIEARLERGSGAKEPKRAPADPDR